MVKEGITTDNSYGLVAFIFGILSILSAPGLDVFIFYGPLVSLILGTLGIIFAIKQRAVNPNKWSQWGLWLSIVGVIFSIVVLVSLVKFITSAVVPKLIELQKELMSSATG